MATGAAAHTATPRIADLPPEIVCAILGRLSNKDLVSARVAHRCFSVQETETTKTRRIHNVWLRTSPERACQAGRVDVLTYLYDHKRIPCTIFLCDSAVRSGSVDMVHLVRERDARWHAPKVWGDTRAIELALSKGHMDIVWYLIDRGKSVDMGAVADAAVSLPCADVIAWLHETRPNGWDAHRALCAAAECGNVDVVAELVLDGGGRLQDVLDTASTHDRAHVVEFLLDYAPWLCPKRALEKTTRSPVTIELLMRRYPDLDARHVLDAPGVSIDVARVLHKAYPQHSLQRFLNNARTVDMVRFACGSGQRLDLQQALDEASTDQRFSVVDSIYSVDATLDLTRAVAVASRLKSPHAIQMLHGACPSVDLQHALDATFHWEFAKGLLRAYPHLRVDALIEQFGAQGEWAFLSTRTQRENPQ
ncbi:Ankyrin repeat domain containing protein [Pandoravirus salinus]|uniref:Ankyrin repeat domain containing protein n=1 Tax=Pandoravirus salinus TaxID=1349410 RepID=S4VVL4_9VIRU|nr:ankyrin repeat domain [Pandoravirus salinus]AGO84408.1 Ankyrin repeat domain containing protein [Pandoravirus salinus]